jgi:CMP-N,N'-diacetyllegionaminic acid synthase
MLGDMRIIAVIPARGGSKSVPKKNIKLLGGKPLIAWPIDVAKQVEKIDRIIVSTDDEDIGGIARQYGAEIYKRPAHLASDEALVIDALRDLYRRLRSEGEKSDVMVLLEPTCPFRSAEDVKKCLDLLEYGADSVATFEEADLNPHRTWRINEGRPEVFIEGADPWLPRQRLPKAFKLNGGVYAFRIDRLEPGSRSLLFGKTGAVVMPKERSVDIDNAIDFLVAENLIREKL